MCIAENSLSRSMNLLISLLAASVILLSGCSSSSDSALLNDGGTNPPTEIPTDTTDDDTTVGQGETPPDDTGTTVHTGDEIPADRVLSELPTLPRTPQPDALSEPVRAETRTTTISEFFAVRDVARDLRDHEGELTDEDFAAGPLPAVITTPESIDPSTNAPPFFVDLDDVEVFAGDDLVVRFEAQDPEGGQPSLSRGSRPEGSQFIANEDGSSTLFWRPLQSNVGIHEFTVTAKDPDDSAYRTSRTIRIRVNLPSDTSAIRNLPPAIDQIWDHTVRVNDPVVVYIKVTDPNDTIPSLVVLNPLPGSTVTPHPSQEAVSILHFVPDTTGIYELELQVIDAVDQSLTGEQTVTIEVISDADYQRSGARLRELASARDLLIGYAALQNFYERPDGAIYANIAGEEFNVVSAENSLKFAYINPLPGKFRWAATDNLVQMAKAQRQVVHGHTLVWHSQLPAWVQRSSTADRELIMREFITRVLGRYGEDIALWDVVNESLEEDGTLRNSVWYESMGASYIDIAFRQAEQSAPNATLIYNDYDIAFAGPKSDGMLALMQQLKDAGTPVDGVGFQMHLFADFNRMDEVIDTFQKVAELDLDIYITELDISLEDDQTFEQQAVVYEQVISACLNQPRCKAIQTWGYTDMYSWRRGLDPLILDERYQEKPAYRALQQRLSEN